MIKSLNGKSCALDCFAWITETSPEYFAKWVGHDGLVRGYHSQELIEIAVLWGWKVTAIERYPMMQNPETFEVSPFEFACGNDFRFAYHLCESEGVIFGQSTIGPTHHAVAWRDRLFHDPAFPGRNYPMLKGNEIDETFFRPELFFRIEK